MPKKLASILVLCLSLACGALSTPEPTATPLQIETEIVTTLEPSNPEVDFGDSSRLVAVRGFSIEIPILYPYEKVENDSIYISNEENTLSIVFISDKYDGKTSLEKYIQDVLSSLNSRDDTNFEFDNPKKNTISGADGTIVNIQGQLMGFTVEGVAIAVSPFPDVIIFGLATSTLEGDTNLWKNQHKEVFETVIKSIKFINPNSTCSTSTDSTYGYTQENPIQVGGDFLEGPARERAYLDNLLGPNGESLSYERQGSTPTDTSIVDIYMITGSGINETLYLDEYNYSEPQAPVGFTCKSEFPLSAP